MPIPNFASLISTGFAVASALAEAYADYEAAGSATIPPIRTYIGTEHVEIDLAIKRLPPP
jgi:hypothetical protein